MGQGMEEVRGARGPWTVVGDPPPQKKRVKADGVKGKWTQTQGQTRGKGKLMFGKDLMKRENKKGCRQSEPDSSLSQRWEGVARREGGDAGGRSHGTTSPQRVSGWLCKQRQIAKTNG